MQALPTFPVQKDVVDDDGADLDFTRLNFGPAESAAPRGLARLSAPVTSPTPEQIDALFDAGDFNALRRLPGLTREAAEAGWERVNARNSNFVNSLGGHGETGDSPTSGVALTDTSEGLATAQGLASALGGFGGRLGTTAANFGLNALGFPNAPMASLLGLLGVPTSLLGLARHGLGTSVGVATGNSGIPSGDFDATLADLALNEANLAPLGLTMGRSGPTTNFGTRGPDAPDPTPAPPPDFDTEGAAFGLSDGSGNSSGDGTAGPGAGGTGSSGDAAAYHKGGMVRDRQKRPRGEEAATLQEGEFVVDRDSTRKYRPVLERMNREEPRGLERLARGRHGRR